MLPTHSGHDPAGGYAHARIGVGDPQRAIARDADLANLCINSRDAMAPEAASINGYAENAAEGNSTMEPGMAVLTKPFDLATLTDQAAEMLDA